MGRLADIKGQNRVIDTLKRSIKANRVAHAYIFEGQNGYGRRTTAIAFIQTLFCMEQLRYDACGICKSCRKIVSGNHPDLHFLSPLQDKRDISIDQIRELQQILSLRPFEAERKACIIEPAERMNEKSANALLKTLEEPPGHAIIILLTSHADILLSTIRSRCQHLRFSPLDKNSVKELLIKQGMTDEEALRLAPLAEGSMEQVIKQDAGLDDKKRLELLAILSKTSSKRISSIFDTAEAFAVNRDDTIRLFDLITSILRDLVIISTSGQAEISNRFMLDMLSEEAARFTPSDLIEALEIAIETQKAIKGNANPKLAMEHFLIGYYRLRKGV